MFAFNEEIQFKAKPFVCMTMCVARAGMLRYDTIR